MIEAWDWRLPREPSVLLRPGSPVGSPWDDLQKIRVTRTKQMHRVWYRRGVHLAHFDFNMSQKHRNFTWLNFFLPEVQGESQRDQRKSPSSTLGSQVPQHEHQLLRLSLISPLLQLLLHYYNGSHDTRSWSSSTSSTGALRRSCTAGASHSVRTTRRQRGTFEGHWGRVHRRTKGLREGLLRWAIDMHGSILAPTWTGDQWARHGIGFVSRKQQQQHWQSH